jgi:hypothetical protein
VVAAEPGEGAAADGEVMGGLGQGGCWVGVQETGGGSEAWFVDSGQVECALVGGVVELVEQDRP